MPQELHGALQVGSERYGIVVSRFNEFITSKLLAGTLDCLKRHGADDKQATALWVPGSFEIPFVAGKMAKSKKQELLLVHICKQNGRSGKAA